MKLFFSLLFYSCIVLACGSSGERDTGSAPFPKRVGSVNDYGDIFTAGEEQVLDSLIKDARAGTSVEIAVVTLDSSMASLDEFNSYTLRLNNEWEIGGTERKGILIGISAPLQRVRINRGLGIGKNLSDTHTKNIMDTFMFPELRKGNYFEGTKLAITEMVGLLQ